MKKAFVALFVVAALIILPVGSVFAATTDTVSVNATPKYVSISNAPSTYDFGGVDASGTPDTTNGHFTITNDSSCSIDVNIKCDGWASDGSSWSYGASGADTGQLNSSSADGGTGGSTGAGDYDITVLDGSYTLLCDSVGTATNPTWELQLEAPSSFTHGDEQTTTVTVQGVAE